MTSFSKKVIVLIISLGLPFSTYSQVSEHQLQFIQKEYELIKAGGHSIKKWIKKEKLSPKDIQQIKSLSKRITLLLATVALIPITIIGYRQLFKKKKKKITFEDIQANEEEAPLKEAVEEQLAQQEQMPRPKTILIDGQPTPKARAATERWQSRKVIPEKGGHKEPLGKTLTAAIDQAWLNNIIDDETYERITDVFSQVIEGKILLNTSFKDFQNLINTVLKKEKSLDDFNKKFNAMIEQ